MTKEIKLTYYANITQENGGFIVTFLMFSQKAIL